MRPMLVGAVVALSLFAARTGIASAVSAAEEPPKPVPRPGTEPKPAPPKPEPAKPAPAPAKTTPAPEPAKPAPAPIQEPPKPVPRPAPPKTAPEPVKPAPEPVKAPPPPPPAPVQDPPKPVPRPAPPPPPPPKVEEKKAPPPPPPPPPKVEEKKAPPPPEKVEAKTAPPATAPAKTGSGYDGPFLEWDRASGDWGGQRTKLRESTGFDVQFRLTADWSRTQSGGVDQHEEASRYWADLTTSFDLGKTGCPGGGKVVASWWQMGETGTPILGAFNVESSIANDRRGELAELYLDQPVVRDSIRLKLGKMDPTADIARTIYGQDFLNIGVTFPPPMFPMPRYPDPAVGGELLIQKTALRGPFASLGVFDGSRLDGKLVGERGAATLFGPPPDMFGVMELGYRWLDGRRPLQMSVGGWMHSGDFAEFTGNTGDGNAGLFGTVEGLLWRTHREDPADPRGLYLVMRYASLDEKVSPVERQYVAAVVWRGPLAFRRQDSLGVAYVFADLTDDAGAALPNDTEQIAELYYKIQLAGFLSLSPDVQYVGNPGGGNDDAIVVGLRLLFDF